MKSFTLLIILALLFLLLFNFRSHGEEQSIITPIDQIKRDNILIRDIVSQVVSGDYYLQSKALFLIEKIIRNDLFDSIKHELLSVLYYLCSCDDSPDDETTTLHIRKKSIELMGRLGEKTRGTVFADELEIVLISQMARSKEIAIVSSAIYALGISGNNNEGNAVMAIGTAVEKWTQSTRDVGFALAVVTSIEKIASVNEGIDGDAGYTALIRIMQSSNDRQIIDKAYKVLYLLSTY